MRPNGFSSGEIKHAVLPITFCFIKSLVYLYLSCTNRFFLKNIPQGKNKPSVSRRVNDFTKQKIFLKPTGLSFR
jgi:hypothetical protein